MDRTQSDASPRDQGRETTLQDAAEYYLDSRDSGIYESNAGHILESFIDHVERRGAETVADLDTRALVNYASHLRRRVDARKSADGDDEGVSAATARNYYDVVSGWLTYCVRRGWLEANPAFRQAPKEELPEDTSDTTTQQRWTRRNRVEITRWADWRFQSAADHEWMDPTVASRDRALVTLFGYTGVRGAEILRDPRDDQREGLRWSHVDLDTGQMRVWAKKREWQRVAIHERALRYLRDHERRQNPASEEWPVFATRHAHTLLKGLPEDVAEAVDPGAYLEAYREHDRVPQSLGTQGGRSVLKTLCIESEIRASDGDVLKPHAARRGLGKELYQQQPEKAQEQLRHEDLAVTNKHYNDVETAEQKESLDSMID